MKISHVTVEAVTQTDSFLNHKKLNISKDKD